MSTAGVRVSILRSLLPPDAFSRLDEGDDARFYAQARLVSHLDARALATVERIIGTLCIEPSPCILDLMASWDSHLPPGVKPARLVGLGLNERELSLNRRLTERVVHDLNRDPRLPFPDETFDVVLNTVSVDYLTRPFEVFAEVGRILRPGGLFLVIFSNRMFQAKAVKIWREASEPERLMLVEDFFGGVPAFDKSESFVSQGHPRPRDDRYAGLGIPSDPIWAVYAEKRGGDPGRAPRPRIPEEPVAAPDPEELRRREAEVKHTLRCPYCDEPLQRWEVPQSPFTEWPNEFVYVCFNNDCPYFVGGWSVMNAQGNPGFSYRLMYDPDRNLCLPVPVPGPRAAQAQRIAAPG
jgi:SAM-dependent methyltransferase